MHYLYLNFVFVYRYAAFAHEALRTLKRKEVRNGQRSEKVTGLQELRLKPKLKLELKYYSTIEEAALELLCIYSSMLLWGVQWRPKQLKLYCYYYDCFSNNDDNKWSVAAAYAKRAVDKLVIT